MLFSYRPYWGPGRKFTLRADDIVIDHCFQNDFIYRELKRRKVFYENDLLFYLAYAATRGGIYVDVGANIGNHSIFFAKYLADFVVSVEPAEKLREQLVRNLADNSLSNQVVIGVAIGNERTTGRLVMPHGANGNYGAGTIAKSGGEGEQVEIHPLQTVLKEYGSQLPDARITLIKIDTEGMGPQVLEGCREVLAEHHPQIVIEAESEDEHQAIDEILRPFGYEQVARFCATPTYYYVNRQYDNPPGRGLKYKVVRWLRKVEEAHKFEGAGLNP